MLENDLLELDEILKPLQSSYTQTGKTQGEPMGETKGQSSDGQDSANSDDDNSAAEETQQEGDK